MAFDKEKNARDIQRKIIAREASKRGVKLTDSALERATEVATKAWQGRTVAGDAAKTGLDVVLGEVIE